MVGLCTALELAATGRRCLVVDREAPAGVDCSAGSAGLIRRGYHRPFANPATVVEGLRSLTRRDGPLAVRPGVAHARWLGRFVLAARPRQVRRGHIVLADLAARSLARYEDYDARMDIGLRRSGVTDVYLTASAFDRAVAETAGARTEKLSPRDIVAGHPGLDATSIAGGLHRPDDLSVDPPRLLDGLRQACVAAGVAIRPSTTVQRLSVVHGHAREAVTGDGPLRAGAFVLAAGAWTPQIARSLGVRLLLVPGKGYHLDYRRGGAGPPVMIVERRVVLSPFPDRTRACGILDLDGYAPEPDARRVALVEEAALTVAPTLGVVPRTLWTGYRPCTADGLPVLGRAPRVANVTIAAGHGMAGIELAPATGVIAAACVTGGDLPSWIRQTAADRFAVGSLMRP